MKKLEEEDPSKSRRKHGKKLRAKQCLLPEEILVMEIFVKIPIKSLLRLSCVCKTWHDLITKNPYFGEKHLKNSNNIEEYCDPTLVFRREDKDYNITHNFNFFSDSLPDESRVSDFKGCNNRRLASCNGILCLVDSRTRPIYLFNPITREHPLRIPRINVVDHDLNEISIKDEGQYEIGFVFDAFSKDYKVVVIIMRGSKYHVYIYKMRTKSWTELDVNLERYGCIESGVFARGFYYWPAYDKDKIHHKILKFEFENDLFGVIEYPEGEYNSPQNLSVMDDSLAFCLITDIDHQIGVWVMVEQEIWMKKYSVKLSTNISSIVAFWMHNMDLVILGSDRYNRRSVIVASQNERECKTSTFASSIWFTNVCFNFRPTLVSLSSTG